MNFCFDGLGTIGTIYILIHDVNSLQLARVAISCPFVSLPTYLYWLYGRLLIDVWRGPVVHLVAKIYIIYFIYDIVNILIKYFTKITG